MISRVVVVGIARSAVFALGCYSSTAAVPDRPEPWHSTISKKLRRTRGLPHNSTSFTRWKSQASSLRLSKTFFVRQTFTFLTNSEQHASRIMLIQNRRCTYQARDSSGDVNRKSQVVGRWTCASPHKRTSNWLRAQCARCSFGTQPTPNCPRPNAVKVVMLPLSYWQKTNCVKEIVRKVPTPCLLIVATINTDTAV